MFLRSCFMISWGCRIAALTCFKSFLPQVTEQILNYVLSEGISAALREIGTSAWDIRRQNWTFVIICSRRPHNCKAGHRKNENVFRMSKDEICTCKACKNNVFPVKYANLWGFCCRRRRGCLSSLLGSFSTRTTATRNSRNNDLIGWIRKNSRAVRTLVQFFDVVCQMTTWNFQI